ncbi:membrane protein insertase YidC [Moraxella nasibovis]|uniref:membrane protein insertase YidC n=1 Tax=Moraxella nasibovis TaxID=2904120 RepID=UPI00240F5DC1|nr:membrane protein insertase YidC [Moraxella nasibovis]WFF38669.1 membrane protein insertase YidC [Moraxella nasibovis]
MQKILRILIIIAILITTYLLVLAWRDDMANAPKVAPVATQTTGADVPNATLGDVPATANTISTDAPAATSSALISVSTDRYDIRIDPVGGDIVHAALKQYDATLNSPERFVLLESQARTYVAQSGLIGQNGIDTSAGRATYTSPQTHYEMGSAGVLEVPLTHQQDGVTITKTYTFKAGEYPINLSYNINNASQAAWQGQMYAQLKRDNSSDPGVEDKGMMGMATYLGGAWGTPEDPYNKLKFADFNDGKLNVVSRDGWVGIIQHYFVSAWTPGDFDAQFYSRDNGGDHFIGFNSPLINVGAGKQITMDATLYAGPKVQKELAPVAAGLEKTVDYGLLWPISKTLFAVLEALHKVLGNWGWAIIGLTILVKIALFWLSNKSYVSMAKMRAIAPKLQALKEKHGDDRMAMSQEMMQLYRDEKVNPMAGCLPILIQMPIFLGLYWCLVESVELRHAPWILWIKDLSAMDPWFILPIIMGATMFIQQLLNPQPTDPMQAKVMKIMPLIFAAFMLFFPAGLVLYWTVNNLFSMVHQHWVNKRVEKQMQARV